MRPGTELSQFLRIFLSRVVKIRVLPVDVCISFVGALVNTNSDSVACVTLAFTLIFKSKRGVDKIRLKLV